MKNLAGNKECDIFIENELKEAGIPIMEVRRSEDYEVPQTLNGKLGHWKFVRYWRYWVASAPDGLGLPKEIAEELNSKSLIHRDEPEPRKARDVIRIGGHCAGLDVTHQTTDYYHVDTQEGLNELSRVIKALPEINVKDALTTVVTNYIDSAFFPDDLTRKLWWLGKYEQLVAITEEHMKMGLRDWLNQNSFPIENIILKWRGNVIK